MRRTIPELRRTLDPRLEWVHDKPIGPERDQVVDTGLPIAWRVRAGGTTVRTARGTWQAATGDWVFLLPCRRHQAFLPGTRLWSIAYRTARPRGSPWYVGPEVVVLRRCRALDRAGGALLAATAAAAGGPIGQRFDWPCTPEGWLRLDAAFRLWLATAMAVFADRGIRLAAAGEEDERVARALAIVERDPWGAAARPAALAAAVGLSRRRLEQLIAGDLGHGLAAARDRRRLEVAQELLGQRELPIKRIAARLGFGSAPGFSAWYRRHGGMPPRRYRQGNPTVA